MRVCGWPSPGDSCGCNKSYKEETVVLPPATVGGTASCVLRGRSGWCRDGATLELSANEPLSGEVIEIIEGTPGGLLCDPADSSSIACSYAGGGEGNFTIEYWAVSSYGDTSEKGSSLWKVDGGPPSVDLQISGGAAGDSGWYRSSRLDVSASGADGISGVGSAEVSINGGGWFSSGQIRSEGVHSVDARVFDQAGNQSTDSAEVRVDVTAPDLSPGVSGTQGLDGCYISPVSAFASASDGRSGVSSVEVRVGSGEWRSVPYTISANGNHQLEYRAQDVAGNEATKDGPTISIDTRAPESRFVTPPEGTWVSGTVSLTGQSADQTSGLLAVELSLDGGSSWTPMSGPGVDWQASWRSLDVANGPYELLARASDVAGNIETPAKLTLRVDNAPPSVVLQDVWKVSETGTLSVADAEIGLEAVEISISKDGMVLSTRTYDAASVPTSISWDGNMPDGTVAEPGEYTVQAAAWDLLGNRASDDGRIIVPEPELEPAPETEPEPEPVPEVEPEVEIEPAPEIEPEPELEPDIEIESELDPAAAPEPELELASDSSGVPAAATLENVEEETEARQIQAQPWLWPAIAWIGFLSAVGIAKVFDTRAKALRDLHEDIAMIQKRLKE